MGIMSRSLTSASVIALAAVCMAVPALAQYNTQAVQTPDTVPTTSVPSTDDTVVVVTGLRRSLASAQAIKQNSEQLVDSITAQDIGKFPDADIAESLQRISGIQIQRNLGEGSVIAIRGLNQVRTELNGHDIFTANGGVGLSFEEVGADLLSRVDVYKNPSAELIEGSLGGTVDLRTRMPFDAKGQLISATAATTYYDLEKKSGQNFSALYSNRWMTGAGEVGFLANASYQTSYFRQDLDQVEPYIYHGPDATSPDGSPQSNNAVPGHENEEVQVQQGGGFNVAEGGRMRRSQSVVFQWRPSQDVELYAQLFNTTYRFYDTGVSYFATDQGAAPVGDYQVVDGVALSGSLANPGGSDVTYASRRNTRTTQFTTGMKWALRDNLHLVLDYEHLDAEVNQDSVNLTINPYTSTNGVAGLFNQTYNYTFDNSGEYPVQLSDNPDFFRNPDNYGFTAIQPDRVRNTATDDSIKADLTWDFDNGFFHKLTAGVRYSRKTAINRDTNINNWQSIGSCANWSTADSCYKISDHMDFVELNPGQATLFRGKAGSQVFGPVWQWKLSDALNPEKAFADVKAINGQTIGFGDLNNPAQSTTSTEREKDFAFYLRTGFGSNLGTWTIGDYQVNFDGNAGLRYVSTDESAEGFKVLSYRTAGTPDPVSNSVITPFDGGRKYDFWLPSLNLRMHLTHAIQLRFAASQNIYRPDFSQINPSFSLSPNYTDSNVVPNTVNATLPYDPVTNPYQGSGSVYGDPNLKPERVTSYDAALEWYFTKDSYAYITVFDKQLHDLIATRPFTRTEDVPNVGVVQFNYTAITNVTQGSVKGFEIGGQKFFDFLPGPLSGLGIAANYTLADSDAGNLASTSAGSTAQTTVPLINLSKNSYNLMFLYDKYGWNGRIAYNWRDKYLDSVSEVGTANLPIYFKPYGSLDASISYDINPHTSLTIDGQNLTNTVQKSYQGKEIYLRNYQMNDRRVSARIRFSY